MSSEETSRSMGHGAEEGADRGMERANSEVYHSSCVVKECRSLPTPDSVSGTVGRPVFSEYPESLYPSEGPACGSQVIMTTTSVDPAAFFVSAAVPAPAQTPLSSSFPVPPSPLHVTSDDHESGGERNPQAPHATESLTFPPLPCTLGPGGGETSRSGPPLSFAATTNTTADTAPPPSFPRDRDRLAIRSWGIVRVVSPSKRRGGEETMDRSDTILEKGNTVRSTSSFTSPPPSLPSSSSPSASASGLVPSSGCAATVSSSTNGKARQPTTNNCSRRSEEKYVLPRTSACTNNTSSSSSSMSSTPYSLPVTSAPYSSAPPPSISMTKTNHPPLPSHHHHRPVSASFSPPQPSCATRLDTMLPTPLPISSEKVEKHQRTEKAGYPHHHHYPSTLIPPHDLSPLASTLLFSLSSRIKQPSPEEEEESSRSAKDTSPSSLQNPMDFSSRRIRPYSAVVPSCRSPETTTVSPSSPFLFPSSSSAPGSSWLARRVEDNVQKKELPHAPSPRSSPRMEQKKEKIVPVETENGRRTAKSVSREILSKQASRYTVRPPPPHHHHIRGVILDKASQVGEGWTSSLPTPKTVTTVSGGEVAEDSETSTSPAPLPPTSGKEPNGATHQAHVQHPPSFPNGSCATGKGTEAIRGKQGWKQWWASSMPTDGTPLYHPPPPLPPPPPPSSSTPTSTSTFSAFSSSSSLTAVSPVPVSRLAHPSTKGSDCRAWNHLLYASPHPPSDPALPFSSAPAPPPASSSSAATAIPAPLSPCPAERTKEQRVSHHPVSPRPSARRESLPAGAAAILPATPPSSSESHALPPASDTNTEDNRPEKEEHKEPPQHQPQEQDAPLVMSSPHEVAFHSMYVPPSSLQTTHKGEKEEKVVVETEAEPTIPLLNPPPPTRSPVLLPLPCSSCSVADDSPSSPPCLPSSSYDSVVIHPTAPPSPVHTPTAAHLSPCSSPYPLIPSSTMEARESSTPGQSPEKISSPYTEEVKQEKNEGRSASSYSAIPPPRPSPPSAKAAETSAESDDASGGVVAVAAAEWCRVGTPPNDAGAFPETGLKKAKGSLLAPLTPQSQWPCKAVAFENTSASSPSLSSMTPSHPRPAPPTSYKHKSVLQYSTLIRELEQRRQKLLNQLEHASRKVAEMSIFAIVRSTSTTQLHQLLEAGLCNVNEKDHNGCTPLHIAASEGNQSIIHLLLSYGADILSKDAFGRTPLDCAAANRQSIGRHLLAALRQRKEAEALAERQQSTGAKKGGEEKVEEGGREKGEAERGMGNVAHVEDGGPPFPGRKATAILPPSYPVDEDIPGLKGGDRQEFALNDPHPQADMMMTAVSTSTRGRTSFDHKGTGGNTRREEEVDMMKQGSSGQTHMVEEREEEDDSRREGGDATRTETMMALMAPGCTSPTVPPLSPTENFHSALLSVMEAEGSASNSFSDPSLSTEKGGGRTRANSLIDFHSISSNTGGSHHSSSINEKNELVHLHPPSEGTTKIHDSKLATPTVPTTPSSSSTSNEKESAVCDTVVGAEKAQDDSVPSSRFLPFPPSPSFVKEHVQPEAESMSPAFSFKDETEKGCLNLTEGKEENGGDFPPLFPFSPSSFPLGREAGGGDGVSPIVHQAPLLTLVSGEGKAGAAGGGNTLTSSSPSISFSPSAWLTSAASVLPRGSILPGAVEERYRAAAAAAVAAAAAHHGYGNDSRESITVLSNSIGRGSTIPFISSPNFSRIPSSAPSPFSPCKHGSNEENHSEMGPPHNLGTLFPPPSLPPSPLTSAETTPTSTTTPSMSALPAVLSFSSSSPRHQEIRGKQHDTASSCLFSFSRESSIIGDRAVRIFMEHVAAQEQQRRAKPVSHEKREFSVFSTVSDHVPLMLCMCGLPGRGKSFISKRLVRYLNWKGVPCAVFNAGNYRRQLLGAGETAGATFFDPSNPVGKQLREKMAELACQDLVKFVAEHQPLSVGILDATNTTRSRRSWLASFFREEATRHPRADGSPLVYQLLFIESVCTDENIITENILRSKCDNDDFKDTVDPNQVIQEFRKRIQEYEKVYEPLHADENFSFIKIINVKHHVVLHRVPCGLGSRVAFFLMNLHPVAFPVYIALPGETVGESKGEFGGDQRLTERGVQYAWSLRQFMEDRFIPNMLVMHSTGKSVVNTLLPAAVATPNTATGGGGGLSSLHGGGIPSTGHHSFATIVSSTTSTNPGSGHEMPLFDPFTISATPSQEGVVVGVEEGERKRRNRRVKGSGMKEKGGEAVESEVEEEEIMEGEEEDYEGEQQPHQEGDEALFSHHTVVVPPCSFLKENERREGGMSNDGLPPLPDQTPSTAPCGFPPLKCVCEGRRGGRGRVRVVQHHEEVEQTGNDNNESIPHLEGYLPRSPTLLSSTFFFSSADEGRKKQDPSLPYPPHSVPLDGADGKETLKKGAEMGNDGSWLDSPSGPHHPWAATSATSPPPRSQPPPSSSSPTSTISSFSSTSLTPPTSGTDQRREFPISSSPPTLFSSKGTGGSGGGGGSLRSFCTLGRAGSHRSSIPMRHTFQPAGISGLGVGLGLSQSPPPFPHKGVHNATTSTSTIPTPGGGEGKYVRSTTSWPAHYDRILLEKHLTNQAAVPLVVHRHQPHHHHHYSSHQHHDASFYSSTPTPPPPPPPPSSAAAAAGAAWTTPIPTTASTTGFLHLSADMRGEGKVEKEEGGTLCGAEASNDDPVQHSTEKKVMPEEAMARTEDREGAGRGSAVKSVLPSVEEHERAARGKITYRDAASAFSPSTEVAAAAVGIKVEEDKGKMRKEVVVGAEEEGGNGSPMNDGGPQAILSGDQGREHHKKKEEEKKTREHHHNSSSENIPCDGMDLKNREKGHLIEKEGKSVPNPTAYKFPAPIAPPSDSSLLPVNVSSIPSSGVKEGRRGNSDEGGRKETQEEEGDSHISNTYSRNLRSGLVDFSPSTDRTSPLFTAAPSRVAGAPGSSPSSLPPECETACPSPAPQLHLPPPSRHPHDHPQHQHRTVSPTSQGSTSTCRSPGGSSGDSHVKESCAQWTSIDTRHAMNTSLVGKGGRRAKTSPTSPSGRSIAVPRFEGKDDDLDDGGELDEVLCPVPALDDIHYGKMNGRTPQWLHQQNERMARMLFSSFSPRSTKRDPRATAADSPFPPAAAPPHVDDGAKREIRASNRETEPAIGPPTSCTGGKRMDKDNNAIRDEKVKEDEEEEEDASQESDASLSGGHAEGEEGGSVQGSGDMKAGMGLVPLPPVVIPTDYPRRSQIALRKCWKQFEKYNAQAPHASSSATTYYPYFDYTIAFPNGESFRQVLSRLEPALMAVMRSQTPVFLVAPLIPTQGLLAFFLDIVPEKAPLLKIPKNCVLEISVKGDVIVHPLPPPVEKYGFLEMNESE